MLKSVAICYNIIIFCYFCADSAALRGWAGQYLIGLCSESVAQRRTCSCKESYTEEHERTFSERYLQIVKLRNFDYVHEDTATKRPCRVYYTRMRSFYPFSGVYSIVYIIYNTLWRGLAELLILVHRQCEGQTIGISEEVSPTSFLCPRMRYMLL